jgi:hypothetical protein
MRLLDLEHRKSQAYRNADLITIYARGDLPVETCLSPDTPASLFARLGIMG